MKKMVMVLSLCLISGSAFGMKKHGKADRENAKRWARAQEDTSRRKREERVKECEEAVARDRMIHGILTKKP